MLSVQQDLAPRNVTCRILVVEDSVAERVRLVAMLSKLGYDVTECGDGVEALRVLQAQNFDIVVSDWRMPYMDGYTLCKEVHQNFELPPYLILLTGQRAIHDMVAAMDAGADDFIAKPFATEELRARLNAGRRVMDLRERLRNKNKMIKAALERESSILDRLQADLNAAETLQRALLPHDRELPDGLDALHYFKGASGVAGDAYNIIRLSEHTIGFYLIDVSGHGIRSAMLSFYATQLLSNITKRAARAGKQIRPSIIAAKLNERFMHDLEGTDYLTMVYGVLDNRTGLGQFCQAGHPNPLLLSADGHEVSALGSNGFPVGIVESPDYEDVDFQLHPGQRLLITSDGLYACRLKSGKPITAEHFAALLTRINEVPESARQRKLENVLDTFLSNRDLEDDISALMIQWLPLNVSQRLSLYAERVAP